MEYKNDKVNEYIARWLENNEIIISDVEDEEFSTLIRIKIYEIICNLRGDMFYE